MGTSTRGRAWIAALLVFVPVLLMLWPGMSLRDQLPPETATHFGASGLADDWTASGTAWLISIGVAAGCGVLALAAALLRHALPRAFAMALFAFLSATMASTWFASAQVTLDAPAPGQERLTWQVLAAIGASLVWGALAYVVHGRPPVTPLALPEVTADDAPPTTGGVPPAPVEVRVSDRLFSVSALILAGIVVVGGIVAAMAEAGEVAIILAVVTIPLTLCVGALSSVRVRVDERGFRLISTWGPTVKRIPADDVAAVAVEVLEPSQWGGWGYRWMPGRSAYLTRRGPGLVIRRRNGVLFAISLADPQPMADALAGYAAAAGATSRD